MKEKASTDNLSSIYNELLNFIKLRLDLLKLESGEFAANLGSSLITIVILVAIALFTLFFISITVGLLLGRLWDNYFLGFISVCAFYITFGVLAILFKDKILRSPIQNVLIKILFKKL